MNYEKIVEAVFLERLNRFLARVLIGKEEKVVHVKNTGRCKELLLPKAVVYLSDEQGKGRRTEYDLVAVNKAGRLINMDSQAPNAAVKEWLERGGLFDHICELRPEYTYGDSRFDFLVITQTKKILIEVKGVTLEKDNVVSFPDAPSQRAIKHVEELIRAKKEGYESYLLFVIQMEGPDCLVPNELTHPAFAEVLRKAKAAGVHILAWDTLVTPGEMIIHHPVPVFLEYEERFHRIGKPLLEWYDRGHRDLPWRSEATAYRVWLSEIMLQQTRVEAVKPYFERFLTVLPDIEALSVAEEEVLLKLWEGLGYYNRARNLKKAAKMVMEDCGGKIPQTAKELLSLPGIGSYTAGAVASIAFGERVPAVDGNVLRVLSRLIRMEDDITKEGTRKKIEKKLEEVMPKERPGDFNQALMELGATVCIPKGAPKCEACPWEKLCLAHAFGQEEEYPKKKGKTARKIEKKTVMIVQDENRSALHKRPEKGLLAGLYEFPNLEGHKTRKQVLAYLERLGLVPLKIKKLPPSRHVFSHREWEMEAYHVRVDELTPKGEGIEQAEWVFVKTREAEEKYPLPSAFAAYAQYLNIRQGARSKALPRAEEGRKDEDIIDSSSLL